MSTAKKYDDKVDMNRDPITGAPGSHPLGTGLGSAGGAAAGTIAGALFGPIGMLVGGAVGAIAGAAAGHGIAEQVDPTGEVEYWRTAHGTRTYVDTSKDFDTDYRPAYSYGVTSRNQYGQRKWDDSLESELKTGWSQNNAGSSLAWNDARAPIRDAWDRADRSYSAYDASDRYYESRFANADYRDSDATYDDYRSAYRYGTYSRAANPTRTWDSSLESELGTGWDHAKGKSRLTWEKAKSATKDAWHSFERALPGDADNDGR